MGNDGKAVIRRTIHDSYGFRFSSPFHYLRRMAEFSDQVPVAAVRFLGVSLNLMLVGESGVGKIG